MIGIITFMLLIIVDRFFRRTLCRKYYRQSYSTNLKLSIFQMKGKEITILFL